jgi:hypothetical protein
MESVEEEKYIEYVLKRGPSSAESGLDPCKMEMHL